MSAFALILTAVILFLVAAAFLAAELFFPSHGLLGVFAAGFAVGGVLAMYYASPVLGAFSALALVIIAPITLYYAIKLYPESPVGKRVMLQTPPPDAAQPFSSEVRRLSSLVGRTGVAVTLLRPGGTCEVDGQRVDSVSESEIITPGTPIEVVRVSGLQVIVRPHVPEQTPAGPTAV